MSLFKEKTKNKVEFNRKNNFKNHDFIITNKFWSSTAADENEINEIINEQAWENDLQEGGDSRNNRSSADNFFNVGISNNLPNNPSRGRNHLNGDNLDGDSNNSDDRRCSNNGKKEADFSKLYKRIRKEVEKLKISAENKVSDNLRNTNAYQIISRNRTGVPVLPSLSNGSVNFFLGGLAITASLNLIIRLNRLGALYRNPFFHLRNRINNVNNFRTLIPALKNFGLLPNNYIYRGTRFLIIERMLRIRNEYRNLIRIMLYFFGPIAGLWNFYRQFRKK